MTDYFLKPAQGLITRVEVGRESYCAVYPEADSEVLYTVCLVPDADAETCPLIAYNVSDCCVCGSPECPGPGLNTSMGSTPADANWPGVPACTVQSQSAVALDCFVQRFLREGLSLRQFTGSILYYAHNSSEPTNETLTANNDLKFIITVSIACPVILCITFMCILITVVLSKLLHRERQRRVQNPSQPNGDSLMSGVGHKSTLSAGRFNVHSLCIFCLCQNSSSLLPLSPFSSLLLGRDSKNDEGVEAEPVDLCLVDCFTHKMARKWEKIGIQLKQDALVANLRQPNCNAESNCTQVIQAAKSSGDLSSYRKLLDILRSEGVGMSEVANELLQAVVTHRQERHPAADSNSQPLSAPSTDDTEDTPLV